MGLLDEIKRISDKMEAPPPPFGAGAENVALETARAEAVENSEEVVRAYQALITVLSGVHQRARMSRDVEELRQVARYLAIADEHLDALLAALREETGAA